MVQATQAVVFSRGQQLQQAIAKRGQFFGWQVLLFFLVSVLLVVLFTRMIIGPVKAVERMINRLGERAHARQQSSVQRAARAAFVSAAHYLIERTPGMTGVAAP